MSQASSSRLDQRELRGWFELLFAAAQRGEIVTDSPFDDAVLNALSELAADPASDRLAMAARSAFERFIAA